MRLFIIYYRPPNSPEDIVLREFVIADGGMTTYFERGHFAPTLQGVMNARVIVQEQRPGARRFDVDPEDPSIREIWV